MRKLLITVVGTVLALGYLMVSAPMASALPCGMGGMDPAFASKACTDCMDSLPLNGSVPAQGTCIGAPAQETQAAPTQQSTPAPQNGCMIQGNGPLLQECPAYNCANINQDQARSECEAMTPAEQAAMVNDILQELPTALSPTPLGAKPPPDTGACSGQTGYTHTACQLFMNIAVWTSYQISGPIENPPPGVGGCCGIRA